MRGNVLLAVALLFSSTATHAVCLAADGKMTCDPPYSEPFIIPEIFITDISVGIGVSGADPTVRDVISSCAAGMDSVYWNRYLVFRDCLRRTFVARKKKYYVRVPITEMNYREPQPTAPVQASK